MPSWTEAKVIALIKKRFKKILAQGAHSLLDDGAVLPECSPGYSRVISCDSVMEEDDFIVSPLSTIESAGYRAIIQNLSDISAMGAKPLGFVWSLAVPQKWLLKDAKLLQQFCKSVEKVCLKHKLDFFGGDLSFSKNKFACNITILGDCKGKPLNRRGGQPGDTLFISRKVGASKAGLDHLLKNSPSGLINYHLYPKAEVKLGQALVGIASACMDISDGLSKDLHRLCNASKTSAVLQNLDDIVHPQIANMPKALDIALASGEEYALLFAVPQHKLEKLKKLKSSKRFVKIGKLVANAKKEKPQVYVKKNSQLTTLENTGYDHFSSFSLGQACL